MILGDDFQLDKDRGVDGDWGIQSGNQLTSTMGTSIIHELDFLRLTATGGEQQLNAKTLFIQELPVMNAHSLFDAITAADTT